MRKFVLSMIFSMLIALISVLDVFLLQAPLLTFVYYGFFSESNTIIFAANIIGKIIKLDVITMAIMIFQVFMTLAFVIVLFLFIKKIVFLFLKDEKLVRVYYWGFFIATLLIPVVLIFLSIFLKGKIWMITFLIIEILSVVLNVVLLIFTNKILPETTDTEHRKYLFTNGDCHE